MSGWLVEALIASALLMAAVLALRGPVRAAFGPGVAYLLWLLPAVRLVLPPLPAGWPFGAATPIAAAGQAVVIVFDGADPAAAATATWRWPALLASVWLAGAALFLGWHLIRYRAFCRRIAAGTLAAERLGGIRVVTSTAAPGPLAFGLVRRFVALPADFATRYDADERACALAHEIGHHRRGDLLANWAALAVLACHWPNPLAWIAFRAFRADQELANDARVLAGRGAAGRHAYARAIVKAAGVRTVSATCHLHTVADLKGRLHMLSLSPASRRRIASGAASVATLAVAGLILTASGTGAAAIAATAQAAVPAPPQPPLPPVALAPAITEAAAPVAKPHKVRRVVVVKDGKTQSYEGEAADAYLAANPLPAVPVAPLPPAAPYRVYAMKPDGTPRTFKMEPVVIRLPADGVHPAISPANMPTVITTTCPPGDPKQTVYRDRKDGRQRVFICSDRIAAMAAGAQQSAVNAQDIAAHARATATASLAAARTAITAERNLTDAQRREALAGIDQAQRELSSQTD